MTRPSLRFFALVCAACAVLVACGARVVPLSVGGAGATATAPVPGGTTPTSTGGPLVNPTGTASTGGGNSSGQPPLISGIPKNCKTGGATDVGVTATKVKLGLVYGHTGPLPGQFDSAAQAVDSYVKAVNDAGGICGRKFELLVRDDGESGAQDLAVAQKLATEDKIFAFVGSVSAPDDSGIAKVSKQYHIPDLGFPLSWQRANNPYTYGVPGQLRKDTIGYGASGTKYLNQANGIKQVAIFWLKESEVSIIEAWAFEAAIIANAKGAIKICHEQPAGVLDNNYTNYVVSMEGNCPASNGPLAVYTTMENNANIKLASAMQDQGTKPKVFAPTFTSYQPNFINEANGATEGAYIALPQIPFERLAQPQTTWTKGTYELNNYMIALNRYWPKHDAPGSFGAPMWGTAALFFEAVKQCGAKLTRACIFKFLDTTGPYSANEFLSPTKPSLHQIYHADLLVQVRGGKFVEIQPNNKKGPPGGPDFWDDSALFNWQKYFCANQQYFPNAQEKRGLIEEC
jgi:ABC-type branched-subunit amino acid transport system substrate-binding protein